MIVWRLTTQKNIADAFNGSGASTYGGRWNSQGTKMIYSSQTLSLAILEMLVHFDLDLSPPLYLEEIEIPHSEIFQPSLTSNWATDEEISKKIGDQWCADPKGALGLKIPSAIVLQEFNILINPQHQHFKKLKIKTHGKFNLDKRLI